MKSYIYQFQNGTYKRCGRKEQKFMISFLITFGKFTRYDMAEWYVSTFLTS